METKSMQFDPVVLRDFVRFLAELDAQRFLQEKAWGQIEATLSQPERAQANSGRRLKSGRSAF